MAALRGLMTPHRKTTDGKTVSRLASQGITAVLETWDGAIRVQLYPDGEFQVSYGQKGTPHLPVVEGNVNDGERHAVARGDTIA